MSQDAALDQAEFALKNRDPGGAERLLLQSWPDISKAPADAQHAFAMAKFAQGQSNDAVQWMRSAVQLEPNSLRHMIGLGHILSETPDHAAAIDAYTTALKIDPHWPGLHLVLSQAYYRAERFEEAERAARQANAKPNVAGWEAISTALRAQGKSQDALAAADEALRLDPNSANAQHAKAAALMGLNRPKEALALFEGLLRQGIDLPVLQLNFAAALEAVGRKTEARDVYEEAAKRWPDLPNLQQRVAEARNRI